MSQSKNPSCQHDRPVDPCGRHEAMAMLLSLNDFRRISQACSANVVAVPAGRKVVRTAT